MENTKDLNYYKCNAEEDYMTTPISVLRYITELEHALKLLQPDISSSSDSFDIEKSATVISVANQIFGGKS